MNAKKKLVKDILTAAMGFLIMWLIASAGGNTSSADAILCLFCGGGLVFGWKIASHILTAVGPWSLILKFLLAVSIGFFALAYVIIFDLYLIIRQHRSKMV